MIEGRRFHDALCRPARGGRSVRRVIRSIAGANWGASIGVPRGAREPTSRIPPRCAPRSSRSATGSSPPPAPVANPRSLDADVVNDLAAERAFAARWRRSQVHRRRPPSPHHRHQGPPHRSQSRTRQGWRGFDFGGRGGWRFPRRRGPGGLGWSGEPRTCGRSGAGRLGERGSSGLAGYLVGAAELGRRRVVGHPTAGSRSQRHAGRVGRDAVADDWSRRVQVAVGRHGRAQGRRRGAANRFPRLGNSAFTRGRVTAQQLSGRHIKTGAAHRLVCGPG